MCHCHSRALLTLEHSHLKKKSDKMILPNELTQNGKFQGMKIKHLVSAVPWYWELKKIPPTALNFLLFGSGLASFWSLFSGTHCAEGIQKA